MAAVAPKPDDGFAVRIAAAQNALAESVMRAGLQKDPYRHVNEALALALGTFPELVKHLEATRQPVRDDDLRRAVVQGISAHARNVIRADYINAAAVGMAALVVAIATGIGIGWLVFHGPHMDCVAERGGMACWYWKMPPTEPEQPVPAPTQAPVAPPAPTKATTTIRRSP